MTNSFANKPEEVYVPGLLKKYPKTMANTEATVHLLKYLSTTNLI